MNFKRTATSLALITLTAAACGGPLDAEGQSDDSLSPQQLLTKSVELCFRFGNAFIANGGDFPSTTYIKGKGVRFKVTDGSGVATYYNADTVTGCKTLSLKKFDAHTIRVYANATFADGNSVQVMNDEINKIQFGWTATTNLVPNLIVAAPGTSPSVTYSWEPVPGGTYTPNISTIMSALLKNFGDHAITSGEAYRVYINQGPCSSTSLCFNATFDPAGPSLWLNNSLTDKFAILHELNHLALYLRLGAKIGSAVGQGPDDSLALLPPFTSWCANGDTHSPGDGSSVVTSPPITIGAYPLGTEEWDNAAFNEAFAQYASASVWNRLSDADCDYRGLDCYEPGRAFDYCYTDAGLVHTLDTGFERDWLTTLYALERTNNGCGIPFQTIVDVIDAASPTIWANDTAKFWLSVSALGQLSGADLTCFIDTLNDRILF